MRLAVIILVLLGGLAAGAAVLLVQLVKDRVGESRQERSVQVVLAERDLAARTKLTAEHLKESSVPVRGLPQGYYTSPAQAIGKILRVDVSAGQPLTNEMVVARGGVADLLSPGMLAFSAPVSARNTAVNLLQPGSIVDVQVTFPLRQSSSEGDAVVFTLLQQVRILGIDADTLASQADPKAPVARRSSSSGGNVMVTLEVSDRQARALALALKHGTLALPLRNPTDFTFYPVEVMVLKEGRLTAGSRSLDPQDLMLFNQLTQLLSGQAVEEPNEPAAVASAPDPNAAPPVAAPAPMLPLHRPLEVEFGPNLPHSSGPSTQKVTIIRAQKVEEVELERKDDEKATDEGDG
ncbi:Flp pilus assembly protein CpaB [Anaerobaca lacustris]|uniref:Flp pilus assembly protein CpaB n=1 Tax=Anaerobaca lacustris TaxID=3044600 RepID=A0AAW6U559_9BACT|nr:Flp pilus assembly protein CpaB [Sedimentisphaerales bacterium M17dextr]